LINFARGVPDETAFPRAQIEECVHALATANDGAAFQYGPAIGPTRLREWIAADHAVEVNRVVVGNGSVGLLDLLCRSTLRPRERVIVEAPCYDRVLRLLRLHGADVRAVRLDADGPVIDDLLLAIEGRRPPGFFYMVPDFQNPSGASYSLEKRKTIVGLARQHGFRLIEDAPYRKLRYHGQEQPSFLDLAADVTSQMNSFSKLLSPALRAAYLIADAPTIARVAAAAEDTYITPGNFALSVTAEWLARGHLGPQVERLKNLYRPRLDSMIAALAALLPEERLVRPEGGFFVGVTLHEGADEVTLHAQAKAAGIDLAKGSGFFLEPPAEPFLRLPFCAMNEATARRGIETIGAILRRLRG
jgi:2-aminoadipate transaminase